MRKVNGTLSKLRSLMSWHSVVLRSKKSVVGTLHTACGTEGSEAGKDHVAAAE